MIKEGMGIPLKKKRIRLSDRAKEKTQTGEKTQTVTIANKVLTPVVVEPGAGDHLFTEA